MASSLFPERYAFHVPSTGRNVPDRHDHRLKIRSARSVIAVGLICAWSLVAWAPETTAAELVPGKDTASIRAWLYTHNPQLRAMQADADAAHARIIPAGALPDPMAVVELEGIDPDHPSLLPGNVGSTTYSLKQRFPLWGKRELSQDVARHEAQSLLFERDTAARELIAQAEDAYVRYWHAREAIAVIDRQIALLEQVEQVAGVRYSLGVAAQQDSIRAQVEHTRMRRERIERLAAGREAMTVLNGALGRRADAVLGEPGSRPALVVADGTLAQALDRLESGAHPALQAGASMVMAANRAVELQRRNRLPDVTLAVGTMQRGRRIDSYELMLEVEIPLQQRARREREHESRLLEVAALARVDAARTELAARFGTAWIRWTSAREQRELIEKTLLPQSDANFKSALVSYQVGEVDFGTLLEALTQWQGADLARVDATRDELLAAAAVRAINGDAP